MVSDGDGRISLETLPALAVRPIDHRLISARVSHRGLVDRRDGDPISADCSNPLPMHQGRHLLLHFVLQIAARGCPGRPRSRRYAGARRPARCRVPLPMATTSSIS